jgi:hypothetical protein
LILKYFDVDLFPLKLTPHMNLSENLSAFIGKRCIINATGIEGTIKDYYRRRTGTGGFGVRFVVERDGESRLVEYEPALLTIDMTQDVGETK